MLRAFLPMLLLGCAAHRPVDTLGKVGFAFPRGENGPNRLFQGRPSQRAIRNAMAHPEARWLSRYLPGVVEPTRLDRALLDEDAWRLEIWYANQGYFDARVLGWTIEPSGRKGQRYVVTGIVDEGEPSLVRLLTNEGADQLPAPIRRRVAKMFQGPGAQLAVGDAFVYADWQDTLAALRRLMGEQSYAYAQVDGDVAVYPDEHAVDLAVRIVPGRAARFGPVTIDGLKNVPEPLVRDVVAAMEGDPFKLSKLEETRAKLYALRVFGVVEVVPDLSEPESGVVPIRIRVTETKPRELRAGPVIAVDPGMASVALQASYRDDNVGRRLWRSQTDAEVGAGVIVDTLDALADIEAADVKPLVDVRSRLELPNLADRKLSFQTEGNVELGLERGYRKFEASISPTLVYSGGRRWRPSVGYRLQYTDYFGLLVNLDAIEDARLRVDLKNPYLLSMLEQRVVYDGRNDPLNATRGWYTSLALAEAGLGGDYRFVRGEGELRAYRGIVDLAGWDPEIVFAGRIGGGVILALGEDEAAAVPLDERLFLGGSNTVRGWGADRLGPYACFGTATEAECAGDLAQQVPVGGELQLYGNVEVRKGLPYDFTLALFTDVGRVWDRPSRFDVQELQWTAGAGLRYATPIGPIRLDVGYRLGNPEYFRAQDRLGIHLSLAEAF